MRPLYHFDLGLCRIEDTEEKSCLATCSRIGTVTR